MFCGYCGKNVPDGAAFCPSCGATIRVNMAQGIAYQTKGTNPQPPVQGMPPEPYPGRKPAGYSIKKAASSGLFLFAIILFSATALWSCIGSFFSSSVFGTVNTVLYYFGMSITDLGLPVATVSLACSIFEAIAAIPGILVAIGLWLIFSSARSRAQTLKTGGLTLIKVMVILRFIFVCIAIFFIEIALIICAAAYGSSGIYLNMGYFSGLGTVLFVSLIFAVALAAVVLIIYYAKVIKMLNSASLAADVGGSVFASVYVVVICFYMALSGVYGFVSTIVSAISQIQTYTSINAINTSYLIARTAVIYSISALSSLCSLVSFILFAIVIINLKNKTVRS